MTAPITIAHISDLHLSSEHKREHIRRTRQAIDYVTRLGVDHMVVTGDITADGLPGDYRIARSIFGAAGLLDPARLTLTIGNHDVFGGVNTAEDVLTFPDRCSRTDEKARIREFGQAFQETFEGTLRPSGKNLFPFARILGDLAIVAVNTVAPYSRLKNPLGSNGAVDDRSFEHLKELLEEPVLRGKRKIVALHHHFHRMGEMSGGKMHSLWGAIERQTMKLRKKARLLKLFAGTGVELVLHGHIHRSMEYYREGVRFLNAGGSVLHDLDRDLHINIVRVLPGGITIDTHRIPFVTRQQRDTVAAPPRVPMLGAPHQVAA